MGRSPVGVVRYNTIQCHFPFLFCKQWNGNNQRKYFLKSANATVINKNTLVVLNELVRRIKLFSI